MVFDEGFNGYSSHAQKQEYRKNHSETCREISPTCGHCGKVLTCHGLEVLYDSCHMSHGLCLRGRCSMRISGKLTYFTTSATLMPGCPTGTAHTLACILGMWCAGFVADRCFRRRYKSLLIALYGISFIGFLWILCMLDTSTFRFASEVPRSTAQVFYSFPLSAGSVDLC